MPLFAKFTLARRSPLLPVPLVVKAVLIATGVALEVCVLNSPKSVFVCTVRSSRLPPVSTYCDPTFIVTTCGLLSLVSLTIKRLHELKFSPPFTFAISVAELPQVAAR